jgi:hypothetical protein
MRAARTDRRHSASYGVASAANAIRRTRCSERPNKDEGLYTSTPLIRWYSLCCTRTLLFYSRAVFSRRCSRKASAWTSIARRDYERKPCWRKRFICTVMTSRDVPTYCARNWTDVGCSCRLAGRAESPPRRAVLMHCAGPPTPVAGQLENSVKHRPPRDLDQFVTGRQTLLDQVQHAQQELWARRTICRNVMAM